MLKKILSIILCLAIFVCSVFICIPFSVKADSIYNTIYENYDYSSVISQHKTFSFTDKGGKKHTVFKATSSSAWICVFGSRQVISDDDELNYYLSWYSYTGYQSILNAFSQFLVAQMGAITKGASTILEDTINNCSGIDIDYNDNDGLTISSDSVDKLREQLKKQYYDSIGMLEIKPCGNVKTLLSKSGFKAMFEQTDDYNDTYARVNNYAYAFVCGYEFSSMTCYRTFFMNELPRYLYLDTTDIKSYSYSDSSYKCYRLAYYDDTSHAFSFNNSVDVYTYHYADSITPLSDMSLYYSFSRGFCYFPSFNTSDYNHSYYKEFMYFGNSSFWFFKSFEALYDYLHGSQTAYLSSKVEEKGEDIKISIDDMNTNISDKMDSLIDSINNKKDGMSADELQKAIDKGLASLSGKMDDIKDNTQETNNKLDSLLSVMQSQNEILMNILGVTTNIYTVVSSKDDEQDKAYDINYVQAVFNTMFKGLKNAVLYGQNTVKQDVNQDTDDVNSLVTDLSPDSFNYRNGLFGKFPFSVPYQLYEWLQVLCAEPVAPSFTFSYDFLMKDFIDEDNRDNFKLIIDLNDDKYKEWADLMRSGEKLAFTIYMAIATYNRFKNEV